MNYEQRFIFLLLLFLLLQSCISIDILTPSRKLADGELLVSNGKKFVLGFFSSGTFSTYKYLGIWLKDDPQQTVIWVANRDTPIIATSPVLSIQTGNLLLSGPNQAPYWVTNISSGSSKTIVAQLLDSGNLVLIQNGKSNFLWQSFDYPTDTVLPNMKLGLDRKTGRDRFLTSWKSGYDPGMGIYSYRFDQRGSPQLFMMKGSVQRWRTGPWNGLRWIGVPEMTHNYFIVNVTVVENYEESSVMYNIVNSSTMTRLSVDQTGSVRWLAWQYGRWIEFWSAPKDQCDFYGHCGSYGKCNPQNGNVCTCLPGYEPNSPDIVSDGCRRKLPAASTCRSGEGFVKVERVKVPDTSMARVNMSMSLEACRLDCLADCSCTAYTCADVRGGGSGCITWYGNLMDTREYSNGGQDLYARVDAFELAQHAMAAGFLGKKSMEIMIPAIVVMSLLFISLPYLLVTRKRNGRKGRSKFLINASPSSTSFEDSVGEEELDESRTLHLFELRTIVAATNNFSSANKLGHGGFGSVYKGRLDNGQEIAVKRLSKDSRQGIEEFKNEYMLIAKLQHRNLVRLFGCCIDREEKMLIYEYLPNKSLDFFIFDEERRTLLDWRQRYEIIGGIARGILYLHQDSRLRIIHRDLKASNVLLDDAMNPKISDFGIARIFGGDQIEANTKRVIGTYGYMSPEYAMRGLYSIKSDVFSFGVLLLEIISGRRSNHAYLENPAMNLIGHVWELWSEGKALDIVDSSLAESYPTNEVMRCIQIALLCVQECATDRPTMLAVVFMLGNETPLPSPKKPAFILMTYDNSSDVLMAKTVACSVNQVTLTSVRAR